MLLVFAVSLVVFGFVALVGLAGYLIDGHADREETVQQERADRSVRL